MVPLEVYDKAKPLFLREGMLHCRYVHRLRRYSLQHDQIWVILPTGINLGSANSKHEAESVQRQLSQCFLLPPAYSAGHAHMHNIWPMTAIRCTPPRCWPTSAMSELEATNTLLQYSSNQCTMRHLAIARPGAYHGSSAP